MASVIMSSGLRRGRSAMRLAAQASVALCGDGVYRQVGGSDAPFNRI